MTPHRFIEHLRQRGYRVHESQADTRAQCPAHGGEDLNMSIRAHPEGGTVCTCHSHHCSRQAIASAVGLTMNDLVADTGKSNGGGSEEPLIYTYRDEKGEALYEVVRTPDKKFWMRLPGREAKEGVGKVRRVLFAIPELLQTKPGDVVAITEGEKCALAVWKLGLPATTNVNGAGKWRGEYTEWLAEHLPDRRFVVLPDNDEEGRQHAVAVGESLKAAGLSVALANLGELPPKGDVVQWIGRGGTAEQLRAMAPPAVSNGPFKLLSFDEVCELPPPIWMVDGLFHEQSFVQIYGETSSGKSLITMDLALNLAAESEEWFGHEIFKPGPVVWINADGGRGITVRLLAWKEKYGLTLRHPFLILMGAVQMNRKDQMDAFRKQLLAMKVPPVLVVFDTQSRCMTGGDENGQADMTIVTDGCHQIKNEVGCTIILLHHADKTGQWERGSGVVKNETDTQMRVDMNLDTNIGTITSKKARDGDRFPPLQFRLEKVLDSVVPIPVSNEVEVGGGRLSKQKAYEEKVLELLRLQPGGVTRKDLEAQVNTPENDPTLYAALRALVTAKRIVKRDDPLAMGRYRKPRRYWLCEPSQGRLEDTEEI